MFLQKQKIFFLIIISAVLSLSLFLFSSKTANAAGPILSNSGGGIWTQKYGVGIGNSTASALTNYQFRVNLSTTIFGNPYANFKANGDDIRFTNSSGIELPYWIEKDSWNNTGNSIVWVKVDSIAASPAVTIIYMYYGNPSATSSSNAQNTFEFFDDFNGISYDPAVWTIDVQGAGSIFSTVASGSVLKFITQGTNPNHAVIKTSSATFGPNHAIRAREKNINAESWYPGGFGFGLALTLPQNGALKGICTNKRYCLYSVKNNIVVSGSDFVVDDLWYNYDLLWTSSLTELRRNDIVIGTNNNLNAIPIISLPVTIGNVGDDGGGSGVGNRSATNLDWIAVRNFINPEPTIAPPSCTLSSNADNDAVLKGESTKLNWVTVNVTNPTINNGIGLVSPAESGNITVGPINSSITYTMTATGPSAPITCSLLIGVIIPPTGGLVPCARLADNLATGDIDESAPCTICAMFYMLKNIINFVMTLAIGVGVFILVIAGLLYASSAGDSGKIQLAKSAVTSAIIGVSIIFIAWMVIAVILQGMGYANMATWNQVNCVL